MRSFGSLAALAISLFSTSATFAVTIDTLAIGNAGNPADMRYVDSYHPSGVGAVAYPFRLGKTEVTNAEYVEFLNAVAATDPYGLYSTSLGNQTWGGIVRSGASGSYSYAVKAAALGGTYLYDEKPVVYVSPGDAMRFANWLHNDQPMGAQDSNTTEDGAYTLNGAVTNAALDAVTRNAAARWWLPSEEEWYKAAYHKNDGVTENYWDYPTGTNAVPDNDLPSSDTGNSANFYDSGYTTGNSNYPLTDVGAYTLSKTPYGTFDQGGNVWEWNETMFDGTFRSVRGGSWLSDSSDRLHASYWLNAFPSDEGRNIGFRVASIPEPATACLGMLGTIGASLWRRGRRCPLILLSFTVPAYNFMQVLSAPEAKARTRRNRFVRSSSERGETCYGFTGATMSLGVTTLIPA